jgi:hypothetical protein
MRSVLSNSVDLWFCRIGGVGWLCEVFAVCAVESCYVYNSLLDKSGMLRGCTDFVTYIVGMAMSLLGKVVVLLG